MTGKTITVHETAVPVDGVWQFRDSELRWRSPHGGIAMPFDPFAAYPHNLDEVQRTAKLVQECCPPTWDVYLYVADREEMGRSNGYSDITDSGHYEGGQWVKDDPAGIIVLSGKRVPPHPAVSRYLVAHEYGHQVEWMLVKARGAKHVHDKGLIQEYAQMRGLPVPVHDGSGGRWHNSATEVFACDFRVFVCQVEVDYWPHPGIPQPGEVPGVPGWWERALADLDVARSRGPEGSE